MELLITTKNFASLKNGFVRTILLELFDGEKIDADIESLVPRADRRMGDNPQLMVERLHTNHLSYQGERLLCYHL